MKKNKLIAIFLLHILTGLILLSCSLEVNQDDNQEKQNKKAKTKISKNENNSSKMKKLSKNAKNKKQKTICLLLLTPQEIYQKQLQRQL
ncbi:complement regulator-acquiring protein [Borreliella garinii]|uniref:complement regulator-acquiring protein n=1 Tax=Borreliella garinii TaxID=29519 RepID=UPI00040F4269|nr:complement regulator-acquiring protein [Borreliella garinii]